MKGLFKILVMVFILSINSIVLAEEYNFIYSEWFDYYPNEVENFRVQSEERTENGVTKTYYRVLNNPVVFFDKNGNLVKNPESCIKSYCKAVLLNEYIPNKTETVNEKIEINNPKTLDTIDIYVYLAIGSLCVFVIVNKEYKIKETC